MMTRTANEWLTIAKEVSPMPLPVQIENVDRDPVYGPLESPIGLMRTVMNAAAAKVGHDITQVVRDFLHDTDSRPELHLDAEWRLSAMRMAVPAVLLDLPIVERLVDHFPATLHMPVDKDLLSPWHPANSPTYSLYGLAFRHALPEMMDTIAGLALKHCDKPGVELTMGWAHDNQKSFGKLFNVSCMNGHVETTFLPSMLAKAIGHIRALPGHGSYEEDSLARMASSALIRDDTIWGASVPAFLALGLYERDIAQSFQIACVHGHAAVIQSFEGRAPWDKMGIGADVGNSQVMMALEGARTPPSGIEASVYEDALLEVARQAVADGRQALFFRKLESESNGWVTAEPGHSVIELKFNRLLVKFLDQGWDPREPALPGAKTMLQIAKETGNTEAVSIISSHGARLKLHSLLDEIGPDGVMGFRLKRTTQSTHNSP